MYKGEGECPFTKWVNESAESMERNMEGLQQDKPILEKVLAYFDQFGYIGSPSDSKHPGARLYLDKAGQARGYQ